MQLCYIFAYTFRQASVPGRELGLILVLLRHYYAAKLLSENFPHHVDRNCKLVCQAALLKLQQVETFSDCVFATDSEISGGEEKSEVPATARQLRRRSERLAKKKDAETQLKDDSKEEEQPKEESSDDDDSNFNDEDLSDDSNDESPRRDSFEEADEKVDDVSVKNISGTQEDSDTKKPEPTCDQKSVKEVHNSNDHIGLDEDEDLLQWFMDLAPAAKRKVLQAQQGIIPETPRVVNSPTNITPRTINPTTPSIKPEPRANSSGKRKLHNKSKPDSGKKKAKVEILLPKKPDTSK